MITVLNLNLELKLIHRMYVYIEIMLTGRLVFC